MIFWCFWSTSIILKIHVIIVLLSAPSNNHQSLYILIFCDFHNKPTIIVILLWLISKWFSGFLTFEKWFSINQYHNKSEYNNSLLSTLSNNHQSLYILIFCDYHNKPIIIVILLTIISKWVSGVFECWKMIFHQPVSYWK